MAAILKFDPNSTPVPGRIISHVAIADTLQHLDGTGKPLPGVLVNPTLPLGEPLENCRVENGVVRLLTQPEKDTIAAALAAENAAAVTKAIADAKAAAKVAGVAGSDPQIRYVRALALVMLAWYNAIATKAGAATKTAAQLKTAIENELDSQS